LNNHPEAFRIFLKASSLLTAIPPKAIQDLPPARTGQDAEESVLFLACPFTDDDLGMAMIEEAGSGVLVLGVLEKSLALSNTGGEYEALLENGVYVRRDGNPGSMHHKVIVIDKRIVVTGSYNSSSNARMRNVENTLII
jgi:hypothetical protein